jgi:hypothetical protein
MIIERQNSRAASAANTVSARTRRGQIRQAHIQERALPTMVIRIAALTALSVLGACVHPSPIQVSADGTQFAIKPGAVEGASPESMAISPSDADWVPAPRFARAGTTARGVSKAIALMVEETGLLEAAAWR